MLHLLLHTGGHFLHFLRGRFLLLAGVLILLLFHLLLALLLILLDLFALLALVAEVFGAFEFLVLLFRFLQLFFDLLEFLGQFFLLFLQFLLLGLFFLLAHLLFLFGKFFGFLAQVFLLFGQFFQLVDGALHLGLYFELLEEFHHAVEFHFEFLVVHFHVFHHLQGTVFFQFLHEFLNLLHQFLHFVTEGFLEEFLDLFLLLLNALVGLAEFFLIFPVFFKSFFRLLDILLQVLLPLHQLLHFLLGLPVHLFFLQEFFAQFLHILLQILRIFDGFLKLILDLGVVLFFLLLEFFDGRHGVEHHIGARRFAAVDPVVVKYLEVVAQLGAGLEFEFVQVPEVVVAGLPTGCFGDGQTLQRPLHPPVVGEAVVETQRADAVIVTGFAYEIEDLRFHTVLELLHFDGRIAVGDDADAVAHTVGAGQIGVADNEFVTLVAQSPFLVREQIVGEADGLYGLVAAAEFDADVVGIERIEDPVDVGAGGDDQITDAVERFVAAAGIGGVVEFYFKPGDVGLLEHFQIVVFATDIATE